MSDPKPKRDFGRTALRRQELTREEIISILRELPIGLTDNRINKLVPQLNKLAAQYQIDKEFIHTKRPRMTEVRAALKIFCDKTKAYADYLNRLDIVTLSELGLGVNDVNRRADNAMADYWRAKVKLKELDQSQETRAVFKSSNKNFALNNLIRALGLIYQKLMKQKPQAYQGEIKWENPFLHFVYAFATCIDPLSIPSLDGLKKRIKGIWKPSS